MVFYSQNCFQNIATILNDPQNEATIERLEEPEWSLAGLYPCSSLVTVGGSSTAVNEDKVVSKCSLLGCRDGLPRKHGGLSLIPGSSHVKKPGAVVRAGRQRDGEGDP